MSQRVEEKNHHEKIECVQRPSKKSGENGVMRLWLTCV